jgi:phenylalanine ammonia-lyase
MHSLTTAVFADSRTELSLEQRPCAAGKTLTDFHSRRDSREKQPMLNEPLGEPALLISDKTCLSIDDVYRVAVAGRPVALSKETDFVERLERAESVVNRILARNETVYGVNTNFGGLANAKIEEDQAALLQENLIWGLKCGAGYELPSQYVRAAMLIRACTLAKGVSGVRPGLISRFVTFLNEDICPVARDLGSIGASGDLVPLAYIAGAITGMSASYKVNCKTGTLDAITALGRVGLGPIRLNAKEGLALVNGTSMLSGIAALSIRDARLCLRLCLWLNALFCQAMIAHADPFDAFVHRLKPHRGQNEAARLMRWLMNGAAYLSAGHDGPRGLVQDRYSIRCIPQFFGPLIDGMDTIRAQVETEMNAVDDNPLVNADADRLIHGGNFLGQYVGVAMDQLRHYIALAAQQLDAQISLLVVPEFSKGLPASLAIETRGVKFGLKGLQICGNSIVPRLLHLANPITSFFPTHAEEFNQNINSQGFNAALLAAQAVTLFKYHLAISCLFAIQSVELRSHAMTRSFDARLSLSLRCCNLYEILYRIVGSTPIGSAPLVSLNVGVSLDEMISRIHDDLSNGDGAIFSLLRSEEEQE